MQNYGWNVTPFEANGQFKIVDIFSKSIDRKYKSYRILSESKYDPQNVSYTLSMNKMLYDIYDIEGARTESKNFFVQPKLNQGLGILVLDTVTPLFSTNTKGTIQLIAELVKDVKSMGMTLLLLLHYALHHEYLERVLKPLTDASITIRVNDETSIFLNIVNYPGEHVKGPFPVELMPD
ncbi:MAG: hypothetical protein ACXACH_00510, partial [Candidatus Hermodarchaeia archaeon]